MTMTGLGYCKALNTQSLFSLMSSWTGLWLDICASKYAIITFFARLGNYKNPVNTVQMRE